MKTEEELSLQAFLFTCSELKQTVFGSQFSVAVCKAYRRQPNTVHSTRCKIHTWELWRSFLLSFRKLVLSKDPGNLNKILKVLSQQGSQADAERIREIRRDLRSVETSVAGVRIGSGKKLRPVQPKDAFDTLINGQLFHNDSRRQGDLAFFKEAGIFAVGAMLHYVVFTYKQALRLEGSIRLRNIA